MQGRGAPLSRALEALTVFRPSRGGRAGRFLEWKVRLFTVAAVLGLTGIFRDDRRLTGIAIVILVAGLLLRFLPGASGPAAEGEGDD